MMVKFKKTLFCCKELPKTSKGEDIFNVLSSYLETHCAGICPDGAPSMDGSIRGFASCKKRKS
jgi:hypothetical protein